jgi:nicotinamide phosphoribosyltransferase
MSRSGGPIGDRVVIRPDSGDPVLIVCGDPAGKTEIERKGAIEALWDIFGGSITEKGFKLLDPHIGLIYGDAITLQRASEIVKRLEDKGFASTNAVFGIGSYTYQYVTRDTFGFALKSTACVINGEEIQIYKEPKTDDGIKKSQKGAVRVWRDDSGNIQWADGFRVGLTGWDDMLQPIFKDGQLLVDESFSSIRKRIKGV